MTKKMKTRGSCLHAGKMKVPALLFLLMVGLGQARSQSITLGVKAGVNIGALRTAEAGITEETNKLGANAGLFARAGNTWFFQPELNYSTFSSTYNYASAVYHASFRQINLPLMAGYKVLDRDDFNMRVSAGPDLNYNFEKATVPAGTSWSRFGIGAVLNAGVDIRGITLDARYSYGITEVNPGLGQRTGVIGLAVGFRFF